MQWTVSQESSCPLLSLLLKGYTWLDLNVTVGHNTSVTSRGDHPIWQPSFTDWSISFPPFFSVQRKTLSSMAGALVREVPNVLSPVVFPTCISYIIMFSYVCWHQLFFLTLMFCVFVFIVLYHWLFLVYKSIQNANICVRQWPLWPDACPASFVIPGCSFVFCFWPTIWGVSSKLHHLMSFIFHEFDKSPVWILQSTCSMRFPGPAADTIELLSLSGPSFCVLRGLVGRGLFGGFGAGGHPTGLFLATFFCWRNAKSHRFHWTIFFFCSLVKCHVFEQNPRCR